MERLILNIQSQGVDVAEEERPHYYIAALGEEALESALELGAGMRKAGVGAIQGAWSRSLRGQMRNANALKASTVIIIGEDEVKAGTVAVREMSTKQQRVVAREDFLRELES